MSKTKRFVNGIASSARSRARMLKPRVESWSVEPTLMFARNGCEKMSAFVGFTPPAQP